MDIEDVLIRAKKPGKELTLSGIYYLVNNDEVVYVGQSLDVLSRIRQHLLGGKKQWDRYCWDPCDVNYLNEVEALKILTFQPSQNFSVPVNRRFLTAKQIRSVKNHGLGVNYKDWDEYQRNKKPNAIMFRSSIYYDIYELELDPDFRRIISVK